MDIITNEYIEVQEKSEDTPFSANIISSPSLEKTEVVDAAAEKLVRYTAMSIKMLTNSYYKTESFIEPTDIDYVKQSLRNYAKNDDKLKGFRDAIINDLTEFQNQIKAKHVQTQARLYKEQQLCERQIQVLATAKSKLVRERLAKVLWPYDAKTKAYDAKISALQITNQKYIEKIENMKKSKPLASEKDVIIYQMQFKEKFTK